MSHRYFFPSKLYDFRGLGMSNADSESKTDTAIAMVATSTTRLPAASQIAASCGLSTVGSGGLLGFLFGRKAAKSKDHEWRDTNLILEFRDAMLAVSLMPAPIPWDGLEGPCVTSWWWPEATERMRAHKYHFIVALIGGSIESVERRVILTKAVRAVVRDSDAVGVYWGEGTVVHNPREFVRQAKSVDVRNIPGPLWIDVRVEKNPDGSFRCFTTGLAPLGFLEIEVKSSRLPPGDLMCFIGDTACYIVNGRKHIKAGETMGRSATEQYKVRHDASMFDRATVMYLDLV